MLGGEFCINALYIVRLLSDDLDISDDRVLHEFIIKKFQLVHLRCVAAIAINGVQDMDKGCYDGIFCPNAAGWLFMPIIRILSPALSIA